MNKLKNYLKKMKEENNELKKSLIEVDEKMKKEIYKIKKMVWDDFFGEGFEVKNGVLGLEGNIYLSIVNFLNSSKLREVRVNIFIYFLFFIRVFVVYWNHTNE
jgi:hypothetical protein